MKKHLIHPTNYFIVKFYCYYVITPFLFYFIDIIIYIYLFYSRNRIDFVSFFLFSLFSASINVDFVFLFIVYSPSLDETTLVSSMRETFPRLVSPNNRSNSMSEKERLPISAHPDIDSRLIFGISILPIV